MIRHEDAVYGSFVIEEPVLLDLIDSPALQRLHGVLQHGVTGLIGITKPVTRFEHSLGVMFLVRHFGGSLEEQIAALLHDVSHTAFSHVVDYVFQGHNSQSYHDEEQESYVASTDLPELLARYGYEWRDFLQEHNFPILEQEAPRLCADRLDYFLRDSLDLELSTRQEVEWALQHLVVAEQRIICNDVTAARWLADTYMAADAASWANFREVGLYELAARAIRRGLSLEILDEQDLWEVDEVLWSRLHASSDPQLKALLALVSPDTRFVWDEQAPTFRVSTKLRTIDPEVKGSDGVIRPLSVLDAAFARRRRHYLETKQGLWPVRVIPAAGKSSPPD